MTQDEYWDKVNSYFLTHLRTQNKQRWGQACVNVLWSVRPDLYRLVMEDLDINPWNAHVSSKTYDRFVDFIERNW